MNRFNRSPAALKRFLIDTGRHVSVIAPVMLLLAAFSVWFAVTQMQKAVASGRQSIANEQSFGKAPTITRKPLTLSGYLDAVNVLANTNPAVTVKLGAAKSSVVVQVSDPALMPEWFYLLSTIQSYRPNLIWKAERICLKQCEGGHAAFAELEAYTQEISVKDLIS